MVKLQVTSMVSSSSSWLWLVGVIAALVHTSFIRVDNVAAAAAASMSSPTKLATATFTDLDTFLNDDHSNTIANVAMGMLIFLLNNKAKRSANQLR